MTDPQVSHPIGPASQATDQHIRDNRAQRLAQLELIIMSMQDIKQTRPLILPKVLVYVYVLGLIPAL